MASVLSDEVLCSMISAAESTGNPDAERGLLFSKSAPESAEVDATRALDICEPDTPPAMPEVDTDFGILDLLDAPEFAVAVVWSNAC